MAIKSILSEKAYHAKIFNSVVYTNGQIGGDMSGKLVSTEISGQAAQIFANLAVILENSDSSLDRVLTANIYLTDVVDYAAFNEVYTKLMPDPKLPRTCVFVKALPANALCEMSLTAATADASVA